jgi:hypothetical protein
VLLMTPEEKSLLERTYKMAEENNAMLHSIRRSGRFAIIMRIVYWAVIILLSFGAYYLIQPYVNFLMNTLGSLSSSTNGTSSASSLAQTLQSLLGK